MKKEEGNKLFTHVKPEKMKLFTHVEGEKTKLFTHVEGEKTKLFTHVKPEEAQRELEGRLSDSEELELFFAESENLYEKRDNKPEKTRCAPANAAIAVTENVEFGGKNFELELTDIEYEIFDTPDGELTKVLYHFEIFVNSKVIKTKVDSDYVTRDSWVKKASRGSAYYPKGKDHMPFDLYISRIIESSRPRERFVYHINGWKKIEGVPVYVYDSGAIGRIPFDITGNKKYQFEFDSAKVSSQETFEQTLGMLKICQDKRITVPLFIFVHMGALTTLFNEAGHPIKFVPAIIGETGSRKTSLSLCMTKTFNRREITEPAVNFNSTEGGIEKEIGCHPDTVLVIDDFMPAMTKGKQGILDTKLEKTLRIYGERKGIERMTDFARNPGAGYYPVRGIGMITGEHIRGVQSSMLRSLIIHIDADSVDNETLRYYQKNYKILNSHIYDFIHFLSENYDDIIGFVGRQVEIYRGQGLYERARYNEMYAQLITTAKIILNYALKRGFMNQFEAETLFNEWNRTLCDIILQNVRELKKRDWPAILRDVCVAIMEDETFPLPKEEFRDYGNRIFEDVRMVYVRMDTFLEKLWSYSNLWGLELPKLSKTAILDLLVEADLLEVRSNSEGKRTRKLPKSKINRQTYLYIKKEKLKTATS